MLGRRLSVPVDVQLADSAYAPLLARPSEPIGVDVSALMTSGDASLRRAMADALESGTSRFHEGDRALFACVPVTMHHRVAGVLVLGARATPEQPGRERGNLELIGPWLRAAVETHLATSPGSEEVLERVSAFRRILRDAASRDSDRALVHALADTLAVWHDFEVVGYVEGQDGRFVRATSLAGADAAKSPATIPADAVTEDTGLVQLPSVEIDRLGFLVESLAIKRLGTGAGSWLIAIEGDVSPHEATVLELYLELLADAIQHTATTRALRAGTAAIGRLFDGRLQAAEQAQSALAELRAATHASTVALVVTTDSGAPFVRAAVDATPGAPERTTTAPLVLERTAARQYVAKIRLEFPPGTAPTRQDYQIAETTADVIESWVAWAHAHGAGAERRAMLEPFADVLERTARQALTRGEAVTFILLSSPAFAFRPGVSRDHVALIRGHVRARDLVGPLADDEIGVLLGAYRTERRSTMVERLRRLVAGTGTVPAHALRMGIAMRTPASPALDTLVGDARNSMSDSE